MSRMISRTRSGTDRRSLYDEITSKIIGELEAGCVPWVHPWGTAAAKAPLALPNNAATGRSYSGINILILWGAFVVTGFLIIFNSMSGKDEPQTFRYSITLNCSMGAEGGHQSR